MSDPTKFSLKISGKPKKVSKEFIRSWIHASACILAYHGYLIDLATLKIKILDLSKRVNHVTGGGVAGTGCGHTNTIELGHKYGKEKMATIIVHECIHVAMPHFGDHTNEKCVSTLTGKMKPDIGVLALKLEEGTYRRAAYIAHTKPKKKGGDMAYRNPEGKDDFYDNGQWVKVGAEDKYRRKPAKGQKPKESCGLSLYEQLKMPSK